MRHFCTYFILIIVMFIPKLPVAQNINEYFNTSEMNMAKKGVILTRARVKGGSGFNLHGKNSFQLPRTLRIPSFLSNYEVLAEERSFIPFNISGTGRLRFYNGLFAFSRFAGTKYYSKTDRALLTYIIESSMVNYPSYGKKLPDPVYTTVSPARTQYYRVKDNRFGEIVFRSDIFADGNRYCIDSRSVYPLKKYGFTIAEKGEYRTISVFLYDPGVSGFYCYSLNAIRVHSSFFASSGLLNAESFANRIRAETVRRALILGLNWNARIKP